MRSMYDICSYSVGTKPWEDGRGRLTAEILLARCAVSLLGDALWLSAVYTCHQTVQTFVLTPA